MVGDILRGEREKQGLTIEDIARETSIRDIYLEAIEKGDYDSLPGDVYAKGFIRNYSRFLQIDGDALLDKYDEERNINKVVQPVDQPQEPPAAVFLAAVRLESLVLCRSLSESQRKILSLYSQRRISLLLGMPIGIAWSGKKKAVPRSL